MSTWAPKRFWKEVTAERKNDGWSVALDGRPVRTPARVPLVVPTQALADEIAAEWRAQEGDVRPAQMPFTRSSNSAIDKVTAQRQGVIDYIAEYGTTDLICYRAANPPGLEAAQTEAWDPLLDWARSVLNAPLAAAVGVMPLEQSAQSLSTLRAAVSKQDNFALTALHDLVMLSGSLVIGLAAQAGLYPAAELWERSRVDEAWQHAQWGEDPEAAAAASAKRHDFLHAARFHALSRSAA